MEKRNTVLTPKEIYQMIKEKPYRDGEALIKKYVQDYVFKFYMWEEKRSGNGHLKPEYVIDAINKFEPHYDYIN